MHCTLHNNTLIAWSPKCGCSAILGSIYGYKHVDGKSFYRFHRRVFADRVFAVPAEAEEFIWYVRDPLARALSCYLHRFIRTLRMVISFREYCRNLDEMIRIDRVHVEPQTANYLAAPWRVIDIATTRWPVKPPHLTHYTRDGERAADDRQPIDADGVTFRRDLFFDEEIRELLTRFYQADLLVTGGNHATVNNHDLQGQA